jgi:hypothetical protein
MCRKFRTPYRKVIYNIANITDAGLLWKIKRILENFAGQVPQVKILMRRQG